MISWEIVILCVLHFWQSGLIGRLGLHHFCLERICHLSQYIIRPSLCIHLLARCPAWRTLVFWVLNWENLLLLVVLEGFSPINRIDVSDLVYEIRLLLRFESHYMLLLGLLLKLLLRHAVRSYSTQLFIKPLNIVSSAQWLSIGVIIHLSAIWILIGSGIRRFIQWARRPSISVIVLFRLHFMLWLDLLMLLWLVDIEVRRLTLRIYISFVIIIHGRVTNFLFTSAWKFSLQSLTMLHLRHRRLLRENVSLVCTLGWRSYQKHLLLLQGVIVTLFACE